MNPAAQRAEEQLLAALVQKGHLTQAQAEECLAALAAQRSRGEPATVTQILTGRGLADEETCERVIRARDERPQRPLAEGLLGKGVLRPECLSEEESTFGRYELLEALGKGAHGVVHLARDPQLGRKVALKILARSNERALQRFRQEMEILGRLEHPNVVRVFDAGDQDGRPYYAMEVLKGRTLRECALPLGEAVRLLEQVALACQAAHDEGIVHRDLKPENIVVTEQRPVIIDFGVAKLYREERDLTVTGAAVGSPLYMAPEQFGGEVGPACDVYALGAILYELLAGRPPFDGPTLAVLAVQIRDDRPAPPRSFVPGLPPALEATALRALEKDPANRQASAAAFAQELRAWLDREQAVPVAGRRRVQETAFVLLVAGASFLLGRLSNAPGPRAVARPSASPRAMTSTIAASPEPSAEFIQACWEEALEWERRRAAGRLGGRRRELLALGTRLRECLQAPDLEPDVRSRGLLALAKVSAVAGDLTATARHLERCLEIARGPVRGRALVQRGLFRWRGALHIRYASFKAAASEEASAAFSDLRAGAELAPQTPDAGIATALASFLAGDRDAAAAASGQRELARVGPEGRSLGASPVAAELLLWANDWSRARTDFHSIRKEGDEALARSGSALAQLLQARLEERGSKAWAAHLRRAVGDLVPTDATSLPEESYRSLATVLEVATLHLGKLKSMGFKTLEPVAEADSSQNPDSLPIALVAVVLDAVDACKRAALGDRSAPQHLAVAERRLAILRRARPRRRIVWLVSAWVSTWTFTVQGRAEHLAAARQRIEQAKALSSDPQELTELENKLEAAGKRFR